MNVKSKNIKNINSSFEDELLVSSQETIIGTSQSTPTKQGPSQGPSKIVVPGGGGSTCHSAPKPSSTNSSGNTSHSISNTKKKTNRSSGSVFKKQYQKAKFILGKIAQNEAKGIVNEKDPEDKKKYSEIVRAYESHNSEKDSSLKRNRSKDGPSPGTERIKVPRTNLHSSSKTVAHKCYNDVVKDNLCVAVVNEKASDRKVSNDLWIKLEAKLSEMVNEVVLGSAGGPLPCFDSSDVVRGYRVIRCEDQFSLDFFSRSIAKIGDAWEDSKIGIIPAREIPRRPRARIWLPRMEISGEKLLECLRLHNPAVPMRNWSVITKEKASDEPSKNSTSFLLLISEESLAPLEKLDNKLRFGIRHTKLKIFRPSSQEADDLVGTSELLEDLSIDKESTAAHCGTKDAGGTD